MNRFLSAIETFTDRVGQKGISLGLLPIIGIVVYEVTLRNVLNRPTIWAMEATALTFGVYTILAGGYVLLHGGHVRMDVLWDRLSPRGKAIADLATCFLSFTLVGALLWFSIPWAGYYFQMREESWSVWHPPIYPSKMLLVVGAFWLFLHLVVKFIRDLYTAIGRDTSVK